MKIRLFCLTVSIYGAPTEVGRIDSSSIFVTFFIHSTSMDFPKSFFCVLTAYWEMGVMRVWGDRDDVGAVGR